MKKSNHIFRKKWGQNFLVDQNLLLKIVKYLSLKKNDRFLEIGPGEGALTELILPNVKHMVSVEIDPMLVKFLEDRQKLNRLHIIHGDILMQSINDLPILCPLRVIGNIPYNITSPIVFWLIEQLDYWNDAFIMMQKEVAKRFSASPGSKDYGRLTVVCGAYLNVKYCFTIPPDVFKPRPKVNSAFVHFTKKTKQIVSDKNYIKFNNLVRVAFSQRRKKIKNTLKAYKLVQEDIPDIDLNRRPETLSVEEYAILLNAIN